MIRNRPLVSFVVLAYNQEKYVEEAVKGALAQTYEPLQIVVSDDCSQDQTFEIVQDVARNAGLKNVRIRRNASNLGPTRHIYEVLKECDGEIIVFAAGDDVSKKERVEKLVALFEQDVYAVFSAINVISPEGEFRRFSSGWRWHQSITLEDLSCLGGIGPGASYAYRREVFYWPWVYEGEFVGEDRIFPFRAGILGRVGYTSDALVEWREGEASLSSIALGQLNDKRIVSNHFSELLKYLSCGLSENRITYSEFNRSALRLFRVFQNLLIKGKPKEPFLSTKTRLLRKLIAESTLRLVELCNLLP